MLYVPWDTQRLIAKILVLAPQLRPRFDAAAMRRPSLKRLRLIEGSCEQTESDRRLVLVAMVEKGQGLCGVC